MNPLEFINQIKDMYNDQDPRPMAQGSRNTYADGQLVTPNVDGSRPGYQGEESTFKDLRKVPPKIRKRFIKVTKYLEELIPKLNAGEKYYTKEQVSSMVEKKFGIKPKYKTTYAAKGFPSDKIAYTKKVNQFEPKRYPVMRTLDPVETKVENTLKNMLIEKKPLNNFWYKALQERTGLAEETIKNYINESPTFKVIKDQGALSLKTRFNKPDSHKFLKDLSFSEQLTQALEMEKGMPRFTGMGKLAGGDYTLSPKFKVMAFAKRNWHANRGKGLIEFFDKNGKRIDWAYGVELPYKDVSFSYKGKRHNIEKLNDIQHLKKNFSKVYETQTAINNLRTTKIDDPLKKGKKIVLEDLVKRNQVNGYKWSPSFSTFDILHGKKGVKGEPFTNLNFNTRDVNQLEMGINRDTTLSQTQKNNLIKSINKLTGTGDPKAIIKRQIALTGDIKSGKITSYEDMKNKFLKQAGFNINKCLSSGGRVGFAEAGLAGVNTCIRGVIEEEQAKAQKGNKISLKKFNKFGKLARTGAWFLGPIDIPLELGFALPHMLSGDKEAAKRATTAGLFGWGKSKMDEIKAGSDEGYKYAKHMKDTNDWMDAWFSQQDAVKNLSYLTDLPEHAQKEKKFIYSDQKLKAEEKMDSIFKDYKGYEGPFAEAKGKSAFKDYLRKDVKEKTDVGMPIRLEPFSSTPYNWAPFKGGQPITNLKQHIAQKGESYWKQLKHAAYEAGVPELFDQYFTTANVRDPKDAYSDLPIKYASQLGKLEKEEMLRGLKGQGKHGTVGFKKMLEAQSIDPQEVWDVGKKNWEFDILGKRHLRASGGRAGYMGGGIAAIRKPHAIPPTRQGLRSIMINVNDD